MTTETETRPAAPPATPYERLGGREVLRAIVDRFYDLMDEDPAYAALRVMHAADLTPMRESLTGFLTGWSGGPRDWFATGKCVMSAHKSLAIDPALVDEWMDAMGRAIEDTVGGRDPEIAGAMIGVLRQMATGVANRPAAAG